MSTAHTALKAQARAKAGKGAARAIRREGSVPAVIYGNKKEPVTVTLTEKDLVKALESKAFFTHMCDLDVEGKKHLVIPRDVQFHPVTDRPLHVDFLRITEKTEISVAVPVVVKNEKDSPGLTKGGVLNVVHHEVEVFCPATDIPEELVIDLKGREVGDSIHIGDIKLPKNVKPVQQGNFTVATIVAPASLKSEEAEAAPAEKKD